MHANFFFFWYINVHAKITVNEPKHIFRPIT